MKFNLTNIKMAKSRNGYSLICLFWINGQHVANFRDKGGGGSPCFDVIDRPLFDKWEKAVLEIPEIYNSEFDMDLKIDNGMFIDLLHAAMVNKTEFKLLHD